MLPQLTPVVKNLIIVNFLVFVCAAMLPMRHMIPDLAMYFPLNEDQFRPYQLVTHMFMHRDLRHVFFNMLVLFFLAGDVERYAGHKDFLALYLLSGVGSMLAHLAYMFFTYQTAGMSYGSAVGASGAVYGVLMAFAILFPNRKMMLLFIPFQFKAMYLALGLIAYDAFFGFRGIASEVGHFAHLGGAFTGGLLAYFWLKHKYR